MGAFKDKILDELYKNNYAELYDVIDQIESDVDVANYISSGKGYYPKMMSSKDLEGMPEFRKALYSELKTGEVDLNKEFGKDWYKHYEQIPSDQIKFVADKQGVDYGKLVKEMGEQATKKRRYDIAHDGTISGYITEFVAPRAVEAVERGESPSKKDVALDVGQNALYAMPWMRALGTGGSVGLNVAKGVAANAATPAIMETADAIAYDDDNPRGNWSGTDVATASMVNATTPWLIRGGMMGAGKLATGKGKQVVDKWVHLGDHSTLTREDIIRQMNSPMQPQSWAQRNNTILTKGGKLTAAQEKQALSFDKAYKEKYDKVLKKMRNGEKLTAEEQVFRAADPDLSKYSHADEYPLRERITKEEALKNFMTNKVGDYWYDQQSPWTRVPVVGTKIESRLKEQRKEEEQRALEQAILEELRKKYGEPRGL